MRKHILLLLLIGGGMLAQGKEWHMLAITLKAIPDTFSFTRKWDYPWYVSKSKGVFSSALSDTIGRDDTAHLFYTANCTSTFQGGYQIRYCTATKVGKDIEVSFADGMPAYASQYYVHIRGDSCWFDPHIRLPDNQIKRYLWLADSSRLVLDKPVRNAGDVFRGYLEMRFFRSSGQKPGEVPQVYLLKGYFSTRVKKATE